MAMAMAAVVVAMAVVVVAVGSIQEQGGVGCQHTHSQHMDETSDRCSEMI
jgi:hypothetical protein